MSGRVPAVYLKVVFWELLSFLPFCKINKLRRFNKHTLFESHPSRVRRRQAALSSRAWG